LVTLNADLNPDRRLFGAGGQARSLYAELTRNLATRTKPEGGAMASMVERFVTTAQQEAKRLGTGVQPVIDERLHALTELVSGYDFATVVGRYWEGHDQGNESLKNDAVRWLRGEFSTMTEARRALGVRTIIDDDSVYDGLKLLGRFSSLAGYSGLLVGLDELVNLFKLPQSASRNANYEQILRILNDSLQGSASHIGFMLGGTPETLTDTRRGLYSYAALQSRLAENRFAAQHGVMDFGGPVIRLANLSPEELFVLLVKLRDLVLGDGRERISFEVIRGFLDYCALRIGAAYFQTPRTTIRAFLDFLQVVELKPDLPISALLDGVAIEADIDDNAGVGSPDAEAASEPPPSPVRPSVADDDLTRFAL